VRLNILRGALDQFRSKMALGRLFAMDDDANERQARAAIDGLLADAAGAEPEITQLLQVRQRHSITHCTALGAVGCTRL
jgi:hypothetical protein